MLGNKSKDPTGRCGVFGLLSKGSTPGGSEKGRDMFCLILAGSL